MNASTVKLDSLASYDAPNSDDVSHENTPSANLLQKGQGFDNLPEHAMCVSQSPGEIADDDSIEHYFSDLLRRVGVSDESVIASASSANPTQSHPAAEVSLQKSNANQKHVDEASTRNSTSNLAQTMKPAHPIQPVSPSDSTSSDAPPSNLRRTAPSQESASILSLRSVAISEAQEVMETHDLIKSIRRAYYNFFFSLILAVISSVFAIMGSGWLGFAVTVILFLSSSALMVQFFRLESRLEHLAK